jgi:alpha-galactosidase
MKVLFWYSVPFIGKHAAKFAEFRDMVLDDPAKDWCVLDPRYPAVRDFLIGHYVRAIRDWGLDGLKLDFIQTMMLTPFSAKDDPRMDESSLEAGIQRLLIDAYAALSAIRPDVALEFRQAYIGPEMQRIGNMFRVWDCPADALMNRVHGVDLRLTSAGTAVHSDPLMWNTAEPVEFAARQLLGALFTVPQISMRLALLPEDHRRMLRFYLDFWNTHRETLLDGTLLPEYPEERYSRVTAESKSERIVVAYGRNSVACTGLKPVVVFNGSDDPFLYVDLTDAPADRMYRVCSCTGDELAHGILHTGAVHRLPVPLSGAAFFG